MARTTWRKLAFGGEQYLWRCNHEHHVRPPDAPGEGRCREVLIAMIEGGRGSLRIEFTDGVVGQAGYPQAGVVWTTSPTPGTGLSANLNLPRMARAAIEIAHERGWDPHRGGTTVLDGWTLLVDVIARHRQLGATR